MYTLKMAKSNFFDRAKVIRAAGRGTASALSKIGAFLRRRSRSSIKPAKQMPLGALTPEQRADYDRRVRIARATGRPRPKRPRASSRPGEPPRSITGLLRGGKDAGAGIVFAYDERANSVVVGPVKLNAVTGRDVPRVLEEGGRTEVGGRAVTIAARPYMGPALRAELQAGTIPEQFRGAIREGR